MMLVLVPCRALIWRKLLLSLLSHLLWITDLSHPLLVHQLLYHLSHSLTLPSLRPNALLPWTSTVPPPLLFYPLILARCILLLFPPSQHPPSLGWTPLQPLPFPSTQPWITCA
ncbi:hypothetical protein KP509_1Z281700 [Ceratopteris richardii]|nr:hypothetical protein KP509_1Z281700 [Ceratopteris richardii]